MHPYARWKSLFGWFFVVILWWCTKGKKPADNSNHLIPMKSTENANQNSRRTASRILSHHIHLHSHTQMQEGLMMIKYRLLKIGNRLIKYWSAYWIHRTKIAATKKCRKPKWFSSFATKTNLCIKLVCLLRFA